MNIVMVRKKKQGKTYTKKQGRNEKKKLRVKTKTPTKTPADKQTNGVKS